MDATEKLEPHCHGLTQLMGGDPHQIKYEQKWEWNIIGLTCDPILGLVQIPCIERNAFASVWIVIPILFYLMESTVSFDKVVDTMAITGRDLKKHYSETSEGALAVCYIKKK